MQQRVPKPDDFTRPFLCPIFQTFYLRSQITMLVLQYYRQFFTQYDTIIVLCDHAVSWVWIQGPNDGWIIVDNNVLTKITLLLLFTKTVIKLRTFTKTEKAKYWILEYENTFFYLNSRSPTYVPTSEPIGRCQIWRNSLQIKNFLRAKIGLIGRCMGWSWHSQCQSQKNQVT